jgi:type VI secretion system secreted protein VgrG
MARMEVAIRGVDAPFVVRRLHTVERLSAWFELDVIAQSYAADLDLDAAIWAPARVSLEAGWVNVRDGGARVWSGLVESIQQTGAELAGLSTYAIRVVPRLYLLTQNRLHRVYTRQTIPDISKSILETHLIDHEWRLDPASFPSLERRVQYGESDYVFLLRLWEEAGITFFFEDRGDRGSVLVLTDDAAAVAAADRRGALPFESSPNEAAEAPFVTRVSITRKGAPVQHVFQDFDFRRPGFALYGKAEAGETPAARLSREYYRPGAFRVDTMRPPPSGVSAPPSKGAGRHDARAGRELAARVALAEATQAQTVELETNAVYLAPGEVFSIEHHPHPSQGPDRWLLVTDYELVAEPIKEWRARIRAVSAEHPYKPQQKTPRPIVHGIQSGIVVGLDHSTAYVDEHGRVKVRLLWEKLGEGEAPHDTTWTRVSQLFTGPGSGIWRNPRIGEEVAVGFFEGNPDEPLILSGIPNAYTPSPYALPEHALKTVWRTRNPDNPDGYTEISMDDRLGQEKLYERSEGVKETHVKKHLSELVEGNRKRAVGGAEDVAVKGDQRELVEGDVHKAVGGEYTQHISGAATLVYDGDLRIVVKGNVVWEVLGNVSERIAGQSVREAADASVAGAGGFIRVNAGVWSNPPLINAGAPGIAAPASGLLAFPTPAPIPGASPPPLPPPNSVTPEERIVICNAICACQDSKNANGNTNCQSCVDTMLRAYDAAKNFRSTIKSEVPFDMSTNPPTPIMSRNEPERATGRSPGGSKIPDIILVYDGSKPPTLDNIRKVIEIKFSGSMSAEDRSLYQRINGGMEVETWTPESPCYCSDREEDPDPVRITDEDRAKIIAGAAALALLLIVLLADDLIGGEADDVAIPGVIEALGRQLAPLLRPALSAAPALTPALAP